MVGAERCPPAGELQLPCGGPQRGACVLGLCVCNAAWQGDACDSCGTECVHGTCALDPVSQMPSCVNCDMGFRGPSCSDLDCPRWPLTEPTSTSSNCAGHGLGPDDGCYQRSGASGTFACACAPGWQGTSCQLPDCSVGLRPRLCMRGRQHDGAVRLQRRACGPDLQRHLPGGAQWAALRRPWRVPHHRRRAAVHVRRRLGAASGRHSPRCMHPPRLPWLWHAKRRVLEQRGVQQRSDRRHRRHLHLQRGLRGR
jgi:hypothetical protein